MNEPNSATAARAAMMARMSMPGATSRSGAPRRMVAIELARISVPVHQLVRPCWRSGARSCSAGSEEPTRRPCRGRTRGATRPGGHRRTSVRVRAGRAREVDQRAVAAEVRRAIRPPWATSAATTAKWRALPASRDAAEDAPGSSPKLTLPAARRAHRGSSAAEHVRPPASSTWVAASTTGREGRSRRSARCRRSRSSG